MDERKKLVGVLIRVGSAFAQKVYRDLSSCECCGKLTPHKNKMELLEQLLAELLSAPATSMVECEECVDKIMAGFAMKEKETMGFKKSQLN